MPLGAPCLYATGNHPQRRALRRWTPRERFDPHTDTMIAAKYTICLSRGPGGGRGSN